MTTAPDAPQIYLRVTAPIAETPDVLARMLAFGDIGCVRLDCAEIAEDRIRYAADTLRETCHAHDVAIAIERHYRLVEPLGLDGVHLSDGHTHYREARKALGPDRIVGCFCGTSKHAGMTAAEMGADYVSFGPFSNPGALGDARHAQPDLIAWWAEMIETPVVVEGGLTPDLLAVLADHADFVAVREEIWDSGTSPDQALAAIRAAIART